MKTFIFLLVPSVKRALCFIHSCHIMINHDPNLQRSRVYEILEEKFCAVRKKCDSKKYNSNK